MCQVTTPSEVSGRWREHFKLLSADYLQVGALVREGRAEEGGDDAHHCVRHVVLQLHIRVLTICRRVAHLHKQNKINLTDTYTMPSGCRL